MKVWLEGSIEETVQNAIKTWEMELSHKTRLQDFKSINPAKFKLFVNGRVPTKPNRTTFISLLIYHHLPIESNILSSMAIRKLDSHSHSHSQYY